MMVERKKDKMPEPKDKPKSDWSINKPDEAKDPNKKEEKSDSQKSLDKVVAVLASSSAGSPREEDVEKAEDALYKDVKKEEGKPTVIVTSISEEEAKKAAGITTPDYINQRVALDRVPGVLNLTMNGTLNSDRSKRMDVTVEEYWEILGQTAGENPLPNREGNELTKIENGFRADLAFGIENRNKAFAERLQKIENKLSGEDKEDVRKMREQLVGA
jgi:hypothetical protein